MKQVDGEYNFNHDIGIKVLRKEMESEKKNSNVEEWLDLINQDSKYFIVDSKPNTQ